MDGKQLRIGNYVELLTEAIKRPSGIFKQIGSITPFECSLYDIDKPTASQRFDNYINLNEVSEIKITEDWLIKFGFKEDDEEVFIIPTHHQERIRVYLKGSQYPETFVTVWSENDSINTKVRYLHQLQNLYFALTGEELKLK